MKDSSARRKIVIHCQYVYGIGHMVRMSELAKGLSVDFEVTIVIGGEHVPTFIFETGVSVIQVPAIYKDESRDVLIPVDTSQTIAECFEKRWTMISRVIAEIIPDVIITEHFPFGLLFQKEVMDMIHLAKQINTNTRVVCSVRDIVESSVGSIHDDHICNILNETFDLILVHGDETFISLSDTFPNRDKIKPPVIHTGYVVTDLHNRKSHINETIIVGSVAGGRVGHELLHALIESFPKINRNFPHKMILFSGAFQPDQKGLCQKAKKLSAEGIELNTFDRQKYLKVLCEADIVVSLGGYNSLIEAISLRKKLLVYQRKFLGNNQEQELRIRKLENSGHLSFLRCADLKPDRLHKLVIAAAKSNRNPQYRLATDGVSNTVYALKNCLNNVNS